MRKSDRILLAGIAVLVGLVAGYAMTSRPVPQRAVTSPLSDVHPVKASYTFPTAFL
jgi:hypothetical protein